MKFNGMMCVESQRSLQKLREKLQFARYHDIRTPKNLL